MARTETAETRGRSWATAGGLGLLALLVRLYDLGGKSLWGDELNMVAYARGTYDLAISGGNAIGYFPLISLADALARWWSPQGEIGAADAWLRLPAALLAAATVPLLYFVARRIAGARVGLLAALLLTFSPMHVAHAQEIHSYAGFCLAALALYELAARACQKAGWGYPVAAAIAFAAGLYLHLFLLFLAVALAIAALLERRAEGRGLLPAPAERGPFFGAAALALLLSFPMWRDWILPYGYSLLHKRLGAATASTAGTQIFDMEPVFELKPATFLRAGEQLVVWRGSFPLFASLAWLLFAAGAILLFRRSRREARTFLLYFFLPLLPIAIFSYLSRIDFGTRRLIFLLPFFFLAIAIALVAAGDAIAARLRRPAAKKAAAALPALLFLGWLALPMLGWYFIAYEKTDLRLANRLLERFAGPDDLVLYYHPKNVFLHYPAGVVPLDPDGLGPEQLSALRNEGGRRRRVIFVRPFNIDDWQAYRGTVEWLKSQNRFDCRFGGGLRLAIAAGETRADSAAEAEKWLRAALEERPARFDLQAFLGQSLMIQGKEAEGQAARGLAEALRPEQRFPTCLPWLCRWDPSDP